MPGRAHQQEARSASLPCEEAVRTQPGLCWGPALHFLSWAQGMVVLSDQPTHKEETAVFLVSAPGGVGGGGGVGLPGRRALQTFPAPGSPRLRTSILSLPPRLPPSANSMGQNRPHPRIEGPPSPRSPSSFLLALRSPPDILDACSLLSSARGFMYSSYCWTPVSSSVPDIHITYAKSFQS